MIHSIYVEEQVLEHERTREILARYPAITPVVCDHFGEIFNRKSQNFRLQKQRGALVLAKKHNQLVHEAPDGYGVGGDRNYYFTHMMNCLYDCRYCFLQGMYRSAFYVLFVNYEDFAEEILSIARKHEGEEVHYFSGYDCDSLALEPVTGFCDYFLPVIRTQKNAWIELRTKSTQIRQLLAMQPLENCIVAFSLSPEDIINSLEHKTPSLQSRLNAIKKLQSRGWKTGLRFDPVIYQDDYESAYKNMFETVFSEISPELLHSVSLGGFRMPEQFFKNIIKLYPDEKLFSGPMEKNSGLISYKQDIEQQMMETCTEQLLTHIPQQLLYSCQI